MGKKEANENFLRKAVLRGDPDALYEQGIRLILGIGSPKEPNSGIDLLNKAERAGQPDAAFALGLLHDSGEYVERSLEKVSNWYRKASEGGNIEAKLNLARCQHLQGNHEAAFRLWNEIAQTGEFRSLNNVGTYLALGIATTKDNVAAAENFKKAVKNGYVIGTYNLGICYELGEGVGQSNGDALRLIESAAKSGYHQAQHHLFECHLSGSITGIKDHSRAFTWLHMAQKQTRRDEVFFKTYALDLRPTGSLNTSFRDNWPESMSELGDIDAQFYVGCCHAYGTTGKVIDFGQAIKWLTKAAMSDHPAAQYVLGCLHQRGLGTKRDVKRAAEWHRHAAVNRIQQSLLITANNYKRGIGVARDEIKAYAFYCAAGKAYKSAFLDEKNYSWKDFAAGERTFQALKTEIDAKR